MLRQTAERWALSVTQVRLLHTLCASSLILFQLPERFYCSLRSVPAASQHFLIRIPRRSFSMCSVSRFRRRSTSPPLEPRFSLQGSVGLEFVSGDTHMPKRPNPCAAANGGIKSRLQAARLVAAVAELGSLGA